jgi:drug/metabolite transporter (DMT)-like permease
MAVWMRRTAALLCLAVVAAVVPVAALFAVATILRNAAFMYLPVATIQLLSSGAPVLAYVLSCLTRLDAFRPALGAAVLVIAGGCAWATSESVAALASSSRRGIAFQVAGLTLEALRSVLLKKVMVRTGPASSSLALLYMVAPVACAVLAVPAAVTEMPAAAAFVASGGGTFRALLCINIVMAVCLNLSSFFFIKTCAVTTTSVTALAKDGVIILGSYAVQPGAVASGRVLVGFGVTLAGTVAYMGLQQR